MRAVTLAELARMPGGCELFGDGAAQVSGVASDSRRIARGDLFAVIAGAAADGAAFVPQAVAHGAAALLSDRALDAELPVLRVDDVRARLGPIAQRVYGEPTQALKTAVVTGTNGKTTVSYLLETLLTHAGARPALLGTVEQRGPASTRSAELTTPEADVIARFAREQLDAGATHLVMEASSHALAQQRLSGITLEVAGFTNLTQDHLDYQGTMEAYGAAKERLFTEYAPRASVVMVDQPFGQQLSRRAAGRVLRASLRPDAEAELRALHYVSTREGIRALVATPHGEHELVSPLFGAHNMENLLVTFGMGLSLGLSPAQISAALQTARGAPGRMERVPTAHDLMVLVDYAHTPDALQRALAAVRPLTSGRLFVVCGCGGDRDRTKRAPMGEAAVRGADIAVLTSDNPRSEDPLQILAEMEAGARRAGVALASLTGEALRGYAVIAERGAAIRAAVGAARAGDTLVIAGKGHENYQIIGRDRLSFDDRVEAAQALSGWGGG
jgi:UDP-N-acetylmuramoyl-L-alanyl-D-glutamate--2,6-diaminopimelate ligase